MKVIHSHITIQVMLTHTVPLGLASQDLSTPDSLDLVYPYPAEDIKEDHHVYVYLYQNQRIRNTLHFSYLMELLFLHVKVHLLLASSMR